MPIWPGMIQPIPHHKCAIQGGPIHPRLNRLIINHMLQIEQRTQMNALKQRLQVEPSTPQGLPTGWARSGRARHASQACYFRPERAHRHRGRRLTSARISSVASSGTATGWARPTSGTSIVGNLASRALVGVMAPPTGVRFWPHMRVARAQREAALRE
jgi:hypothetical protein